MQPEQPLPQQPAQPVEVSDSQPPVAVSSEQPVASGVAPIQWQAPEYVQERRSPLWFIAFWFVAALLMVLAAFVLKSWSFAILVPAMAAALMIYSHRPPRMLSYVLSSKGIYINEKLHPMEEFRGFGVLTDESLPSMMLIPSKRFRPGLTIHFPGELGEQIVDVLGSRMPMREIQRDLFDKLIRKLHI